MSVEWIARTNTAQLLQCAIFVQKCHDGKKIPHSQTAYSNHSLMTTIIATEYTSDIDIHCAAMLKDVLMNPLISHANLKAAFGPRVSDIVKELTYDNEKIIAMGRESYLKEKCLVYSQQALWIECFARLDMLNNIKHIREGDAWSIEYANETINVFINNIELQLPVKLIHQLSLRLQDKGYIT